MRIADFLLRGLRHVFRCAIGPGVVARRECYAFRNRGMAESPKLDERIWIGFIESLFSEDLKGVCGNGRRIRNEAVYDFESINVGLVFLPAAIAIGNWLSEKTKYRRDQQQGRQAGPIRDSSDVPAWTPAAEKPMQDVESAVEQQQTEERGQDQGIAHVPQDVVSHLVTENHQNF